MLPNARDIFSRFQNLNLLILIQDLRRRLTTSGDWEMDRFLCPIAHGMPDGATVGRLKYLSQSVNLERACSHAATVLGTHGTAVRRFVDLWDAYPYPEWLLEVLEHIWNERRQDAEAVQQILAPQAVRRSAAW
ncbi:MAG: hypothetical protein U0793_22065 [Gemmataceae bacterium]